MSPDVAVDRDALYYPFIHITDVTWLKATLLCFPSVRRMVPQSYVPSDSAEIKEFCDIEGPRGVPLLTRVDLFSSEARAAEQRLLALLEEHDSKIRARYSKAVTMRTFRTDDLCQLHDEKILARLYTHLTGGKPGKALAWRIPPPPNRPHRGLANGSRSTRCWAMPSSPLRQWRWRPLWDSTLSRIPHTSTKWSPPSQKRMSSMHFWATASSRKLRGLRTPSTTSLRSL